MVHAGAGTVREDVGRTRVRRGRQERRDGAAAGDVDREGAGQRGADPASAPADAEAEADGDAAAIVGVAVDRAAGAVDAGAEIAAGEVAGVACDAPMLDVDIGSSGTISSATMLMILIRGLTAGPAVSL
jgi:hypothetical protein